LQRETLSENDLSQRSNGGIMQLARDLQKQLEEFNSSVQLATTIDGTFPTSYAFMQGRGRQFRAEFASDQTTFAVVLFEIAEDAYQEKNLGR
jgi:hypothetical protein